MLLYPGAIDCPSEWEYANDPSYNSAEVARVTAFWLMHLRKVTVQARRELCRDTRPFHRDLFRNLAPSNAPYFAGNYRGDAYFCLEEVRVTIPSDPRVGYPPAIVLLEMFKFGLAVEKAVQQIAFMFANPVAYPPRIVIVRMAQFVAGAFVRFLTIHPFVNGNGHAARFFLNALFGVFGYWIVSSFPVHKRPHPDYATMIHKFRDGETKPLVEFLLHCLS